MFSTETIAILAVGGALAIILPIAAMVIYRLRHKETSFISAVIGAGTFIVFAMILEQLLHLVMLPLVKNSIVLSSIYAALAAGVFEETGRLVAYKTLMKKHYSTKNAVLMGLGHGGTEAVIILGITLLAYAGIAVYANEMGLAAAVEKLTKSDPSQAEAISIQLNAIKDYNVLNVLMPFYERLVAVIFHVCMSVWVYKAVTHKLWLYPAAIAVHALLDLPAALFQMKALNNIATVYVILTLFVMAVVFLTIKLTKKFPDKKNECAR